MPSLTLNDISVRFGGLVALDSVSAEWTGPGVIGLLGPNGAGKTTLLNVMSGLVKSTSGSVHYDGQDMARWGAQKRAAMGVIRSFQTARLLEDNTVLDNIMLGVNRFDDAGSMRQFFASPKSWRNEQKWRAEAMAIAERLELADRLNYRASALSTATRRLVEIGRVLMAQPNVVLLDEPAAGLDAGSREHLADRIRELPELVGCLVVLVEHDVGLVRRCCEHSLVLSAGKVIASGRTLDILDEPAVRTAYFGE
ncbi:MAG: ABC transporter ATP-binding protein [Georgenia sp.]